MHKIRDMLQNLNYRPRLKVEFCWKKKTNRKFVPLKFPSVIWKIMPGIKGIQRHKIWDDNTLREIRQKFLIINRKPITDKEKFESGLISQINTKNIFITNHLKQLKNIEKIFKWKNCLFCQKNILKSQPINIISNVHNTISKYKILSNETRFSVKIN